MFRVSGLRALSWNRTKRFRPMLANTGFVSLSVAHDPPTTFQYPSKLTLPLASMRAWGGTRGFKAVY